MGSPAKVPLALLGNGRSSFRSFFSSVAICLYCACLVIVCDCLKTTRDHRVRATNTLSASQPRRTLCGSSVAEKAYANNAAMISRGAKISLWGRPPTLLGGPVARGLQARRPAPEPRPGAAQPQRRAAADAARLMACRRARRSQRRVGGQSPARNQPYLGAPLRGRRAPAGGRIEIRRLAP